jgi:D-psicose/D-tagatose/L-ribulose 3-epimerase
MKIGINTFFFTSPFTTDVKVIARAAAIWRRTEPTRDEIAVNGLKFLRSVS